MTPQEQRLIKAMQIVSEQTRPEREQAKNDPVRLSKIISVWVVFDVYGKEVPKIQFAYNQRKDADDFVAQLNTDRTVKLYYVQPKKIAIAKD